MTPYEIMLSESQERMLIVLENGKEDQAKKIFDKWNLDFAVIGKTTNSKKIELFFNDNQVADIPVNTLVENSPMYDRKWKKAKLPKKNKIKKENLNNLNIIDDMIKGDVMFCATAITDGDLADGIKDQKEFFEASTIALHKSGKVNTLFKNKHKK